MTQYGLKEEQITAIKIILAQHEEVEQAILFGSRAKGNYKPASDIDLVLKGEKLNITIQNKIANELDDLLLPFIFDLSVFHQISNEDLVEHIERVGIVVYKKNFRSISSKLKPYKFEELLAIPLKNGLTKPSRIRGEGLKMVNMGELFANPIIREISMDRVPMSEREVSNFLLEPYDLLFARQSLTVEGAGKCSLYIGDNEQTTFESHLIRARINIELADPTFVYYLFSSKIGRDKISSIVTSTAASGIRGSDLLRLSFDMPELDTQKEIAAILSALDDKIELNRQTNQTLEEVAKTLFQEMCVPKGDELPDGWRVGKLREVCNNVRRTINPQELMSDTAYIGLEHIPRKSLALSEFGASSEVTSQKSCFKKYDILFGKLRPYFHKVCIAPFAGICSTDILVFEPVDSIYFSFCLNHLFSDELIRHVSSIADGTRMPRVDWKSIGDYEIAIPDIETIERLNEICFVNYERLIQNSQENHTLVELRDSLLPKLINGEIITTQ